MSKNTDGPLLTNFGPGNHRLGAGDKSDFSDLLLGKDFDPDFLLRDLHNETSAIETAKEMRAGRATADDVRNVIERSGFYDMELTIILFAHELKTAAKRWQREQRREDF